MTVFTPLTVVDLTCTNTPDRFGTAYVGTEDDEIMVELNSAGFNFSVSIDSACARKLAAALLAQADVFDTLNNKGA